MYEIIQGDCLDVMKTFEDNKFSCVVTDPPYGLHFMGKTWDHFKKSNFDEKGNFKEIKNAHGNQKTGTVRSIYSANANSGTYDEKRNDEFQEFIRVWALEAKRILKPGSFILMFGAPRRHHRQMAALEDAGFEIRDCLMWLFGQGFPKSHNFGKQMGEEWEGYGSALKPAYEPIIMAMKPLDGTFMQNAEKWGVAGLNIDDSRIETKEDLGRDTGTHQGYCGGFNRIVTNGNLKGRWPANLLLDEAAAQLLDQQSGLTNSSSTPRKRKIMTSKGCKYGSFGNKEKINFGHDGFSHGFSDSGGASRFFYCAKSSSAERNAGLEGMPLKEQSCYGEMKGTNEHSENRQTKVSNFHPTVKPLKLMEYLIKLIMPPKDGLLLDPFAGSGTTILAAKNLGFDAIGIEKEAEYVAIARARLEDKQLQLKF